MAITPLEAYNELQRGFSKLSSPRTKSVTDVRHPDRLKELLDALAPAVMGAHGRAQSATPANTQRQKTPQEIEAENLAADRDPVCKKCHSIPCECGWVGADT